MKKTLPLMSRSIAVRAAVALAMLSIASLAIALARQFPADSYQVNLQAVNDPAITIDGTTVQLAAGVLIFNANNATLVKGTLTPDVVVRVEFNGQCQVKRLWVLKDEEIIPVSFWQWLTSGSFTPPCSS